MNALNVRRFCRVAIALAVAACVAGCPPALGPFQWAQTGGGRDADRATAVAPRGGGAYLCGQFTGSAVFGARQPGQTLVANGGPYDTDLIARYETDGTWTGPRARAASGRLRERYRPACRRLGRRDGVFPQHRHLRRG